MIEGTLIINLDPPYMGFLPHGQAIPKDSSCHHCNHEQIRNLLLDLNIITADDPWPLREFILRLPIALSRKKLLKHGLLKPPMDVVVYLPMRRTIGNSAAMSS